MPPETCSKHDETMQRIFDKINSTDKNITEIKTQMKEIAEFKDMVHKIVFGNGRDGLLTKVSKCFHIQTLQWTLFVLVLVALIGVLSRIKI